MRKADSNKIRGYELQETLKQMGYDIDPGLIAHIPIGNSGYRSREGVLKNGKLDEVWYYDIQNVQKFLDNLADFKLADKLKERGYEIEPGWAKYFPYEFADGKYSYNLDKVIAFLNSTTTINIRSRLKERGYDISDEYLEKIGWKCSDYSGYSEKGFSTIDLEKSILFINSVNTYNLPEKLKERGVEVDEDCLKRVRRERDLYRYEGLMECYDLDKVIQFVNNYTKINHVSKMVANQGGLPEEDAHNNYFGTNLKDFYSGVPNLLSRFPISKWYVERYHTIPDVCNIGRIYIEELLDDPDFKVRWTFKGFTDYDAKDRMGSDKIRTFGREQMGEYIIEALLEIEDGMFMMLNEGSFFRKDESMQANAVILYKEGVHDPSAVLVHVSDKYVVHNESGTLGLLYLGSGGFGTQDFTIPEPKIDFNLNYNNGFKKVHDTIFSELARNQGKGLVLLHGKPGTGKTTYLRYLINRLNKNKIFVPPNLTGMLSDPGFIPFLIENPDCVLFVEDAENVLRSREDGQNNQAVSNILNITDGLLSDCLNIQIVATFNTHIGNIDEALLRKGRLIAQYEFTPLKSDRAEKLANSLHVWLDDTDDLTLADIYAAKTKS